MKQQQSYKDIFESESLSQASESKELSFVDFFSHTNIKNEASLNSKIESKIFSLMKTLGASRVEILSVPKTREFRLQQIKSLVCTTEHEAKSNFSIRNLNLDELLQVAHGQNTIAQQSTTDNFIFMHNLRPIQDLESKDSSGILLIERSNKMKSFNFDEISLIVAYTTKIQSLYDEQFVSIILDNQVFAGLVA